MSIGKKFSTEKLDLTDQERLEILESRLPILIDRIQTYDKIVEMFGYQQEQNKIFIDQNKILNDKNKILEEKLQSLKSSIESETQENKKQINIINNNLSFHEKQKQNFEQKLNETGLRISGYHKGLDDFTEKLHTKSISIEKFNDFLKNYEEKIYSICQKNDSIVSDLNQSNGCISILKQKANEQNDYLSKLKLESISNQEKLEKINEDIEKCSENTLEAIKCEKQKILDFLTNKIEDTKNYIDSTPSSIAYIRKEFSNRLESIQLDSDNASQKSSNNDKSIKLLEKKLENLSLLIKKIELSQ